MPRLFSARRLSNLALLVLVAVSIAAFAKPASLADQLAGVAAEAHESGELNGNVFVARGDQVLYEASFGTANASKDTPNTADSRFMIASVSKPFTAVLVLQLVEQKKLATDARLDAIFPA